MNNKPVANELKKLLADSYVLYLKTQNYHWNVTGANFKSLHDLFQLQYEDLTLAVDEIAERIRTLGEVAPGSFKSFLELTSLEEANDNITAEQMVKDLSSSQEKILNTLKTALKVAQNAEDEATIGILVDRITTHEKNKWMLDSSI